MNGEILKLEASSGIVLGENGQRYSFVLTGEETHSFYEGAKVNFEAEDRIAKDILIINSQNRRGVFSAGGGDLKSDAMLAAIGAGLPLFFVVPFIGWIIAIVGIIMELYAVKKLAERVGKPDIFGNLLIGFILGLVGEVVVMIAFIASVGMSLSLADVWSSLGAGFVIGLLVNIGIQIYSFLRVFKAFTGLADAYGVGLFKVSAFLYLLGMLLLPFGVGALILFGFFIIQIVAYLSIKDVKQQAVMPSASRPAAGPARPARSQPPVDIPNAAATMPKAIDRIVDRFDNPTSDDPNQR